MDGRDKEINIEPSKYNQFTYGYASTVHRAQGVTVDKTFIFSTGNWVRNLTYVAMSRHRKSVKLYADKETYIDFDSLKKSMSREGLKDSVLDYPLSFAARRGIDVENVAIRFKNHVIGKLKEVQVKIKDTVQKTLNYEKYYLRKSQELEQIKSTQETLNRREDAKLIATYVDANRKVGETWMQLKNYKQEQDLNKNLNSQKIRSLFQNNLALKAFQNAESFRDKIAAEICSKQDKDYSKVLEHYNISTRKLQRQSKNHHARQQIQLYLNEIKLGRAIHRDKIANDIFQNIKSNYKLFLENKISMRQLKYNANSHLKRVKHIKNINKNNPIEEYLFLMKQRDLIPPPWLKSNHQQKDQWRCLNKKMEELSSKILSNPIFRIEAKQKKLLSGIQSRTNYFINLIENSHLHRN